MTNTFNYLKREMWDGFSVKEKLFMWGMVLLQILVYIVAPDSWYGVVAGIAGCISVVLTAKGRWMMYPIGFIQNFTYTVLAFQNMFYGEVIEQIFYIVTMIWGMVAWARNMHTNEDGTQDVNTRKFGLAEWLFTIVGVAIGTWLFGRVLVAMGAALPYTDAATNINDNDLALIKNLVAFLYFPNIPSYAALNATWKRCTKLRLLPSPCSSCGLRNTAQSAGDRVNAFTAENAIAIAMVIPNC